MTVYAPDTEPSLHSEAIKREPHNTEDSVTQANTLKIDETILHRKNSPATIPASTRKDPASKKAIAKPKKEPLDFLFDVDVEGEPSFPPAEVKSKHEKKTPLTITATDTKPLASHLSPLKSRPPTLKTRSGRSQPHPEDPSVSALPGVKKKSPNMSEILAPQSVESVQDPNGSILAPSSLTPRSQDVPDGAEGKSLPDSDLMSVLFKGKKKKRSTEGEGEGAGLAGSASASSPKRQRLERGTQRDREKEEAKNISGGGGLFAGVQRTRGRKKRDTETVTSISPAGNTSQTNASAPEAVSNDPKLAPDWDTTAELPTLQTAEEVRADRTDNHTAPPITPTRDSDLTMASKMSRKRKFGQSSSPFLSARKQRKSSREDAHSMHDTPYTSPSKPRTQTRDRDPDTCTETTNTLATAADTQKSAHAYSDLTSPFTCLAVPSGTGGRRTKVQDVETHQSEDFWDNSEVSRGGLDTEDPLEPPRRTYKPVCTDEGFIRPRDMPKLQVR